MTLAKDPYFIPPSLSPFTPSFGMENAAGYQIASFSATELLHAQPQPQSSVDTGPQIRTFAFGATSATYSAALSGFTSSIHAFSAEDRDMARKVLKSIEAVCNIQFVELPNGSAAQIQFAYSDAPNLMGTIGYGFFPGTVGIGGSVWIGTAQKGDEWAFRREALILHETLHALGLDHPPVHSKGNVIPNTVMSYNAIPGYNDGVMSALPVEPMQMDIQALQLLYGSSQIHAKDDTYDLNDERFLGKFATITDAGGDDTLSAIRSSSGVVLDLRAGNWSNVGAVIYGFGYYFEKEQWQWHMETYVSTLSIAQGTELERAIGSQYADVLAGNETANVLIGGDGDDILAGLGGDDILIGGDGIDTAWYPGLVQDYRLAVHGTTMQIDGRSVAQGSDSLQLIERVVFNNASLDLSVKDLANSIPHETIRSVVSLYVGILGRIPDVDGLKYWLSAGLSIEAMADIFSDVALNEVRGQRLLDFDVDRHFIEQLYKYILGRTEVDLEGMNYWRGILDRGDASHGGLALKLMDCLSVLSLDPATAHVARAFDARTEAAWLVAGELGVTWNDPAEGAAISQKWLEDAPEGAVQIQLLGVPMYSEMYCAQISP